MHPRPITIALAQMRASDSFEANLQRGSELAASAAKAGAELLVFTELAFRPFFPQHRADSSYFAWAENLDGETSRYFLAVAQREGIDCAVNFFERGGAGQYFDSTVICCRDGRLLGPVRMAHAAEEPGYNEKYYYWPGDTHPAVWSLPYAKIGVAICYDRHFPEYTRPLVLAGAEIILCPFAGTTTDPLELYRVEMQGLAFQNQVFVACVNRTGSEATVDFAGGSFVVSPDGTICAEAPFNDEHLLLANLDLQLIETYRIQRPFLRDRRPRFYAEFQNR